MVLRKLDVLHNLVNVKKVPFLEENYVFQSLEPLFYKGFCMPENRKNAYFLAVGYKMRVNLPK